MDESTNGRSDFEKWLDRHNPILALIRTFTSALAAIFGALVTLKVFGIV